MARRRSSDSLAAYRRKRRAGATPEPFGRASPASLPLRPMFVVQHHQARALHFDLRLEHRGVLKSWAVPKGPSPDPADKRFARLVEDHPLEYADFEGRIPEDNYGAGWVIVWDRGTFRPLNDFTEGLERGKLLFELNGFKLHGRWTLVRMKSAEDWLLIKERDESARETGGGNHEASEAPAYPDDSVLSGLTLDELPQRATLARRTATRIQRHKGTKKLRGEPDAKPMLATAGEAFDRAGWVFELKYDGYRMLARRRGGEVELLSRTGRSLDAAFPDVARAVAGLPCDDLLLDGEVVVHDDAGRPGFSLLQQRAGLTGAMEVADAARHLPAVLYAFDLPAAAGRDLRALPLTARKKLLASLLPVTGLIRYSEHVARHGLATFDSARRLGLEGIVAKRGDSPYRAGRSRDWIKVRTRKTDDFVIAGWVPGRSNDRDLGALALAEYRAGVLTYVGRVGSGFKRAARDDLRRRLNDRPAGRPLTDDGEICWIEPREVCEVAYREYTAQGHLRQPVFVRVRDDKPPEACIGHFDAPPAGVPDSATAAAAAVHLAGDPRPHAPAPAAEDVPITNPEKVFFPESALTKRDLVRYYRTIAPWMLPYLKDRPVVLTRYPDGIHGKRFYQRDAPDFVPDWIERRMLWSDSAEREVHYFVVADAASLVYLANLGTIPIHTWHSRTVDLEHPDWCVLDLDPKGAPFQDVVKVARAVGDLADEIGLPAYPKTSGASGLHVLIPLARQLTHDQAKTLGELLARVIVTRLPDIATVARAIRQREGKVYVDYLQNGHGKLLVAPFSVRAEPAASVSMPLRWKEVNARLSNDRYTIQNALRRMSRLREDPLADVLRVEPDLQAALAALLELTG